LSLRLWSLEHHKFYIEHGPGGVPLHSFLKAHDNIRPVPFVHEKHSGAPLLHVIPTAALPGQDGKTAPAHCHSLSSQKPQGPPLGGAEQAGAASLVREPEDPALDEAPGREELDSAAVPESPDPCETLPPQAARATRVRSVVAFMFMSMLVDRPIFMPSFQHRSMSPPPRHFFPSLQSLGAEIVLGSNN
jgi:hypothetical protein